MTEHQEQCALIEWAQTKRAVWPEIAYIYAIPNGAKLPYKKTRGGKRYSREAIWLLKEGLLPGVSDLFLPAPRSYYHGAYIEMKYGNNTPTEKQIDFIKAMRDFGYAAVVVWGWMEAKEFIENYMGLKSGEDVNTKYLPLTKHKE